PCSLDVRSANARKRRSWDKPAACGSLLGYTPMFSCTASHFFPSAANRTSDQTDGFAPTIVAVAQTRRWSSKAQTCAQFPPACGFELPLDNSYFLLSVARSQISMDIDFVSSDFPSPENRKSVLPKGISILGASLPF